jgi:hypothetical protein
VLGTLTQFGLHFMPLPPPGVDAVTPNSLVGILRFRFNPETAVNQFHRVELQVDGDVVYAIIAQGTVETGYGLIGNTSLVLKGEPAALFQLFLHETTPKTAVASEKVACIQGDLAQLEAFWRCFHSSEA